MNPRYANPWCSVHEDDANRVAAGQLRDTFDLAILDGAYGFGKASWDRVSLDDLHDWYRPHLEDTERLCAPSATLYLWNTAAGWARLDPEIRRRWTYARLITWDKAGTHGSDDGRPFPECAEVCAVYVRGEPIVHRVLRVREDGRESAWGNVWRMHHRSYAPEKLRHPSATARSSSNRRKHLDVVEWAAPLHPTQKPLAFADRIIRASSDPGSRIWVPFGGTLREALAATRIGIADPHEGRHVVTCEINQDGVDYLSPAIAEIEEARGGEPASQDPPERRLPTQARLW
jgi:DNA modification methylase